jgi:hypothetical protein
MKAYQRIEDGVITQVSVKEALGEVNEAMIGRVVRERRVRTMSSSHGHHVIEYSDGRKVKLDEIDAPEQEKTEPAEWSTTHSGFTAHRFNTATHKALCNRSFSARHHTRAFDDYRARSWVEQSSLKICPRCDAK